MPLDRRGGSLRAPLFASCTALVLAACGSTERSRGVPEEEPAATRIGTARAALSDTPTLDDPGALEPGGGAATQTVGSGAPSDSPPNNGAASDGPPSDDTDQCLNTGSPAPDDGDPCTLSYCDPASGPLTVRCSPSVAAVVSRVGKDWAFLYSGPNAPQTGVRDGAIDAVRAGVLRGRLQDRQGAPLADVTIAVLGHPELGTATSRTDGSYDFVANGGGTLVLDFRLDGYLESQRRVQLEWGGTTRIADVALLAIDFSVTPISVGEAVYQVARGPIVTDGAGTRQATLLIPPGTTATLPLADGSTVSPAELHVRATESSLVGAAALPGDLPLAGAEGYTVELSADEALDAGASRVDLSQSASLYIENFRGIPVGTSIPAGYYDRALGQWIAAPDGRVIGVLGVVAGVASLDADGNGSADTDASLAALGISLDERRELAALYAPGSSLWRIPISQLSPWDGGFTTALASGACAPGPACGGAEPPAEAARAHEPCSAEWDQDLACANPVVEQRVALAGTPFSLVYSSERALGQHAGQTLEIPITGNTALPSTVRGVELQIEIAGRVFQQSFSTAPLQSYSFLWDGADALGRVVRGAQAVTIRRGHRYGAVYQQPPALAQSFGQLSGVPLAGSPAAGERTLWSVTKQTLRAPEPAEPGLGGWALSVHHTYDPIRHVILRGDGGIEDPSAAFGASIGTEAGTGSLGAGADGVDGKSSAFGFPSGVAAAPDGSVYIADTLNARVRRLAPDGSVTTLSGEGTPPNLIFNGSNEAPVSAVDQIPGWTAVSGDNWQPRGSSPDPFDGGQYFFAGVAEVAELRQDVDVSGFASTIDAGQQSFSFEGYVLSFNQAPADSSRIVLEYRDANNTVLSSYDSSAIAQFVAWRRLADTRSAPPGTRSIRVRLIATRAGGSNNDGYFDGLSLRAGSTAVASILSGPRGLALGADGSLYVADTGNNRVRRLDPAGHFVTVAGTGQAGFGGDGGLAIAARLSHPRAVAVAPDGDVYIADSDNFRIRKVSSSGVITTLAGTGTQSSSGDGGPSGLASVGTVDGLALAPDGTLLFAESSSHRVRALGNDGLVHPFAGTGTSGFAGDGAAATNAQLSAPTSVFAAADGRTFIADTGNARVRVVGADGRILSFAGTGVANSTAANGDGGPALAATLHTPGQIALGPDGALHVADTDNQRVRRIAAVLPGASTGDLLVPSANGREIYRFSGEGLHLETLRSLNGALLYSFAYDSRKRLLAVTDEVGRVTELERDSTGDVTAIVGPYGQRTTLGRNAGEYLASVMDPEGASEQFGYGAGGLLTRRSDALGNVTSWAYDPLGRLTRAVDASGASTLLTRSRLSSTRSHSTRTTPLGRSTSYDAERLADGSEQSRGVRPDGSASQRLQHPDGTASSAAVDGTQLGSSATGDPRWGTAVPVTSVLKRLPSGLQSVVLRTREVALSQATDPFSVSTQTETEVVNGRSYRSVFDAAAGTFTLTSPMGRKLVRGVDSFGRTLRFEVDGLTPVEFAYDADGRLSSSTQGERTTSFDYFADGGALGYLQSATDALGQTLDTDRDGVGRVIRQSEEGIPTTFSWDPTGELASVAPPGRPSHALTYTPRQELAAYTPPAFDANDPSTTYAYDADRALVREAQPGGVSRELDYDAAGRLSQELAPTGALERDYYAATATAPGASPGQLAQLSGPGNISLSYTYDGELQTGETVSGDVQGALGRAYDANFSVVRQTLSAAFGSRATAFGYDSDLLLTCASPTSCSPAGAGALSVIRDPRHGLVSELTEGTLDELWSYDGFGALAAQTLRSGSSVLSSLEYDAADGPRDALSRITRQAETFSGTQHVVEYAYDVLGELTDVSVDGLLAEHYEYDFSGNRSLGQTPDTSWSASYDVQDRLQSYGPYRYSYTPNGELLAKADTATSDITEYTYDTFGNLLTVALPDARRIDYVTDGRGRRLGKKVDGVLVAEWLYADEQLVAELDGAGNLVSSFAYASRSDVPDYLQRADGSIYRIVSDQRGNVRLVLNANDPTNVLFRADYSAFGERTLRAGSADGMPFGFAGGLYDADTGLVRIGARDYDPESGRWTAKDPLRFASGQANLYVRLGNDPVNHGEVGKKWLAPSPAAVPVTRFAGSSAPRRPEP